MKRVVFILPGLILGFLLGRVGPSLEKAALEEQLTVAEDRAEKAERKQGPRNLILPGMGEVLSGAPDRGSAQKDSSQPDGSPAVQDTGGPGVDPGFEGPAPDIAEQFELAVEAQRLRTTQSRAALIEQADLDDRQIAEIDSAMLQMNDELALLGEDLMTVAMSGEEPDPTEMLGLSHDVTGILYEAQLTLEDSVGLNTLDGVDPQAAQVWNYIELEGFRDAVESFEQ
ncbi:MAG: hypothetical protein ACI9VR_005170 [Cognaticolwellia sp.]|jgi:hypothetical protein